VSYQGLAGAAPSSLEKANFETTLTYHLEKVQEIKARLSLSEVKLADRSPAVFQSRKDSGGARSNYPTFPHNFNKVFIWAIRSNEFQLVDDFVYFTSRKGSQVAARKTLGLACYYLVAHFNFHSKSSHLLPISQQIR